MDENLLTLLEELSLRTSNVEDEDYPKERSNYNNLSSSYTSSSNVSSPSYEQLSNNIINEDLELKSAVNSLFQELNPPNVAPTHGGSSVDNKAGYDKSKLLVALLGNFDLVTCAIKKINQLVSYGKRMEQIYRCYYVDPSVPLDLVEINQLISAFLEIYNSENYVREVNVTRVYHAYCKKLIDIYNVRTMSQSNNEDQMMT